MNYETRIRRGDSESKMIIEESVMHNANIRPAVPPTHALRCLEVWSGNQKFENAISVPGIDAWVVSQPYAGAIGGGDIHYVSLCGGGKIARFIVADVAGHGEPVSALALKLRALMRRHINKLDQTRFVRSLNKEFAELAGGGTFATAVLMSYFAPTDQLVICNAGHPPPLWYRSKTSTWQVLRHDIRDRLKRASNLPLGIVEPTSYHQFVVQLDVSDLVLVYTDALIEATNAAGRQLRESGLLNLVSRLDAKDPNRLCRSLLDAVADYHNHAPSEDDATLVLLHHNAADPPKQSLGEKMHVMSKMLGLNWPLIGRSTPSFPDSRVTAGNGAKGE